VSKSFGKLKVLDSIFFTIRKGESIGLVGRSGCGKSVLLKIIIGFLSKDSGEISIDHVTKDKIGFSMQNNSLYEYLTVRQNLNYFSKLYGIPRKKRRAIIPDIIKKLRLEEFEKVLVKELSGGTRKRVDIACALLNNPDILILDEPFLGLDPELVSKLAGFILELNRKGTTILISSHRITELGMICSRFVLMKEKKLNSIGRNELANAYR
jgi:ABC-2 type transport system ATP-binding protein